MNIINLMIYHKLNLRSNVSGLINHGIVFVSQLIYPFITGSLQMKSLLGGHIEFINGGPKRISVFFINLIIQSGNNSVQLFLGIIVRRLFFDSKHDTIGDFIQIDKIASNLTQLPHVRKNLCLDTIYTTYIIMIGQHERSTQGYNQNNNKKCDNLEIKYQRIFSSIRHSTAPEFPSNRHTDLLTSVLRLQFVCISLIPVISETKTNRSFKKKKYDRLSIH